VITDKDYLLDSNGRKKIALNFPSLNEIRYVKKRWNDIKTDPRRMMAIALHELFGLKGIERGDYHLTSQLLGIKESEIEMGRFALLHNQETFRYMATPSRHYCVAPSGETYDGYLVKIEVDPDYLRIIERNFSNYCDGGFVNLPEDAIRIFQCKTDEAQDCVEVLHSATLSAQGVTPPFVETLSVLPDGNYLGSRYSFGTISYTGTRGIITEQVNVQYRSLEFFQDAYH